MDYAAFMAARQRVDTFTFRGNEYPVKSIVELTPFGRKQLKTNKKYAQLTSHVIFPRELHRWYFIIDWTKNANGYVPTNSSTKIDLDEIIEEVVMQAPLIGENEPIQNKKETSYWHPDIIWEGIKMLSAWFSAFIFKDWFLRLVVQIGASVYFGRKIETLHNSHYVKSYNTVEFLYGINQHLIIKYYLDVSVIVEDEQ